MRSLTSCVLIALSMGYPAPLIGQQSEPLSFYELWRRVKLDDPAGVVQYVREKQYCFDFALSPSKQDSLRSASWERNPNVQPPVDIVLSYVRTHPCQQLAPERLFREHPLTRRETYWSGFGRHYSKGKQAWGGGIELGGLTPIHGLDITASVGLAKGKFNDGTVDYDYLVYAVDLKGRTWFYSSNSPFVGYIEGGGLFNIERFDSASRTAEYASLGLAGGAGVGFSLSSHLLLTVDLEQQVYWQVHSELVGTIERENTEYALPLTLTLTWFP